jgi:hypothetical protein
MRQRFAEFTEHTDQLRNAEFDWAGGEFTTGHRASRDLHPMTQIAVSAVTPDQRP